jgi:ABC-type transporter Mla subunit MlaD
MRTTHLLAVTLSGVFFLGACAPDAQEVLLENYLTQAEEIGNELVEAGAKFETLMNVQNDALEWSEAEKDELKAIVEAFDALTAKVEFMSVPDILSDIHPLLVEGIGEMRTAVAAILDIANDPSKATESAIASIESHATRGEELADEYVVKMEAAVEAAYPDALEE